MKGSAALIIMLLPAFLNAASFSDIMTAAQAHGTAVSSAAEEYESGMIGAYLAALDDKPSFTVSAAVSPLEDDISSVNVSDLSFSAVLPDGDTTMRASIPMVVSYDGSSADFSPSLSAEHVFDWGHGDDALQDLQSAQLRLSAEAGYRSSLLSFRSRVISAISSILSSDLSIADAEENLRDLEKEMSDAVALGNITEGSILHEELLLEIRRAEDTLDNLDKERNARLFVFSNLTGLEWDGVDDIPLPAFPDILSAESSSSLDSAAIEARIASENLLIAESELSPSKLTVGGNVSSLVHAGSGTGDEGIAVTGTAGWSGRSLSISVSGGGTWDRDWAFTPSLTITGSWTSNPAGERERLELRQLMNEAVLKRNDLREAEDSFAEEGADIWNRILSWQMEWDEMEAEIGYREVLLGNIRTRYSRGLAAEEDVHDAEHLLFTLGLERSILALSGLSLEAEAEMHIL